MKIPLVNRYSWFLVIAGIAASLAVARVAYLEEQGNFHPITAQEAYRSAQLDRDEVVHVLGKYQIRAVINLRGGNIDEHWYVMEKQVCREHAVMHWDLHLSASKAPTPQQMKILLGLFKEIPRPVLIHCKGGADRSGLVAAMWKVVVDGESKSIAKRQLSIWYGHVPFGPTHILDEFFDQWRPDTAANHLSSDD